MRIATNRFVTGSAFTVADITAFCVVDLLKRTDVALTAEFTQMWRWYGEVGERPSARA